MIKKKMKVKNIIWSLIGILFLIIIIIPSINMIVAYNLRYSKPGISERLYEINTKYPSGFMKDESIYNLSEAVMGGFVRNSIFMGARLGSKDLDYDTITSTIKNYEKIINDYPKSQYFTPAYQGILDSYIFLGESGNLEKWIDWGKDSSKDEIKQVAIYYDGYNHFVNRDYDEVERILEGVVDLGDPELDYIYYFLKGHVEFMEEDFDKALEYYGKASDIGWQHGVSLFGDIVPDQRKSWLESLRYKNGKNKIKGRVISEDRGIPFVPVYVQYPNEGYRTGGGNFVAITDKDGYFKTIGIKDGEYDIGIGIGDHIIHDKVYLERAEYTLNLDSDIEFDFKFGSPMKVIKPGHQEIVKDDKFTVEWEEVEGADYYTMGTIAFSDSQTKTGSMSFTIQYDEDEIYIKDNKIILDVETLNNQGGSSSWSDDDSPVNPESVLGYFHSGAERPLVVKAFDSNGNMLSSSIPSTMYYDSLPSVIIKNSELTEGEKIILSQDYERAIEYYEERLNRNEEDEEALKYLSKINMVEWKRNKSDFDKAIKYGKDYYEVTGDKRFLNRALEYKESYEK